MARIKAGDLKELIIQYENEDITLLKFAEELTKLAARGNESWGELEAEWNESELTVFQWLELYYHPPTRKI